MRDSSILIENNGGSFRIICEKDKNSSKYVCSMDDDGVQFLCDSMPMDDKEYVEFKSILSQNDDHRVEVFNKHIDKLWNYNKEFSGLNTKYQKKKRFENYNASKLRKIIYGDKLYLYVLASILNVCVWAFSLGIPYFNIFTGIYPFVGFSFDEIAKRKTNIKFSLFHPFTSLYCISEEKKLKQVVFEMDELKKSFSAIKKEVICELDNSNVLVNVSEDSHEMKETIKNEIGIDNQVDAMLGKGSKTASGDLASNHEFDALNHDDVQNSDTEIKESVDKKMKI